MAPFARSPLGRSPYYVDAWASSLRVGQSIHVLRLGQPGLWAVTILEITLDALVVRLPWTDEETARIQLATGRTPARGRFAYCEPLAPGAALFYVPPVAHERAKNAARIYRLGAALQKHALVLELADVERVAVRDLLECIYAHTGDESE